MQIHRIPPGNPTSRKNITIAENRRRNGSRGVQAVGGSLANPLVKQTRYRKTRNCTTSAVSETAKIGNHPDFLSHLSVSGYTLFVSLTDCKRTDRSAAPCRLSFAVRHNPQNPLTTPQPFT